MAAKKKISFETGISQLEVLVNELDRGTLPLQDSFDAYEKGKTLIAELSQMLDAGEKRMTELTESGERPLVLEEDA